MRAGPEGALPLGTAKRYVLRILAVLGDAKIRFDMQPAHLAPLQRDDVVHDMKSPSAPERHPAGTIACRSRHPAGTELAQTRQERPVPARLVRKAYALATPFCSHRRCR